MLYFRASHFLRLFMAASAHGAAAAIPPAGTSSFLFISAKLHDDTGDQPDQQETDEDRSSVFHDCIKHTITPSGSVWWLPDTF